jgi:DNA-binding phage protein
MKKTRRSQKQTLSAEEAAHEIYAVFIQGHRATRVLQKNFLRGQLHSEVVRSHFLKLCMEYDRSKDLSTLREGLLLIVKTLGASEIAKATKINRVTLYRMLGKGGNPGIKNLIALLKALDMGLWVVDLGFYDYREQVRRRSGKRA